MLLAGCVQGSGWVNTNGYRQMRVNGRKVLAHKHAYEQAYGSVPDGMVIDHRCHNRQCVNVEHLHAVTVKQNAENRAGANRNSATGIRGVSRAGRKWRAQVGHHGRRYTSYHATVEEASRAVAERRAHLFSNTG